jgi:exodeoxyribonuclease V alpha subunit
VYDEHFTYIPATADNIADLLVNDYITKVNQYGITNVMLCSAMRERGCVSVKKLNERLQEIYTKGHTEAKFSDSRIFRVGDRVMQTKNDYSFILMHDGKPRYGVFNGEKGTVARITYDAEDEDYKVVVVFDDGSIGGYKWKYGKMLSAFDIAVSKTEDAERNTALAERIANEL